MTRRADEPLEHACTLERTVLFTDVVESTQWMERYGITRWVEFIHHHRRVVATVSGAHGGTVRGFTGDGFLVVFRTAADGVAAALRLHDAFRTQQELDIRIGVSSGAVVTDGGLCVLGLCVHRAARLCARCEPGELLVDEPTYRSAVQDHALPPLEHDTLQLRGFREPTRVCRARARTHACIA